MKTTEPKKEKGKTKMEKGMRIIHKLHWEWGTWKVDKKCDSGTLEISGLTIKSKKTITDQEFKESWRATPK